MVGREPDMDLAHYVDFENRLDNSRTACTMPLG